MYGVLMSLDGSHQAARARGALSAFIVVYWIQVVLNTHRNAIFSFYPKSKPVRAHVKELL